MAEPRAQVKNAASPDQVKRAARKEREAAELARAALQATMRTQAGRIVMWDLLVRAGVFRSIWSPNAEIHYRAGRQDFGHELMAALLEADEDAYQLMEVEARQRLRRENAATDAAHTPSVTEGEQTDGNAER